MPIHCCTQSRVTPSELWPASLVCDTTQRSAPMLRRHWYSVCKLWCYWLEKYAEECIPSAEQSHQSPGMHSTPLDRLSCQISWLHDCISVHSQRFCPSRTHSSIGWLRSTPEAFRSVVLLCLALEGIKRWCCLTTNVCLSVWRLSICLSRTSGIGREQRGLGRLRLAQR